MLDHFYEQKSTKQQLKQLSQDMIQNLHQHLDRSKEKLKKLKEEFRPNEGCRIFKVKGEILTAYMHEINQGQEEVVLPNFYDQK